MDKYGNLLKSVAIGYGRKQSPLDQQWDRDKQTQTLIAFTENEVTNPIDQSDDYRTPLPAETRIYQLTGFNPQNNAAHFSFEEWTRSDFAFIASATEIPYEQAADNIRGRSG